MDKLNQRPDGKMNALTSLRFFAAIYVVLFHTAFLVHPGLAYRGFVGRFLALGYISVSFFFLLSGYILALVYLNPGRPVQVRRFYRARFARIYPLFFATLLLDTPHLLAHRLIKFGLMKGLAASAVTFIATAAMLQAWSLKLQGIDDPNWSLSVETFFYLVFPLLGVALWKISRRRVLLLAALVYVAGQCLISVSLHVLPEALVYLYPLLHLSTFLLGVLFARWQSLCWERVGMERCATSEQIVACLLACVAGFLGIIVAGDRLPAGNVHDGLLAPLFCLMIWVFSNSNHWPARLLSASWLVVLGEASFGLYLIHIPVLHLFQSIGWAEGPLFFAIYLCFCIGLSTVTFYLFETPIRRCLLRQPVASTHRADA